MANNEKPAANLDLTSLGTSAARNLATTTKSAPQMQGITSRWLLKLLPWVQVTGGTYRVNRRLSYEVGDGKVSFAATGAKVQVIAGDLGELAILHGLGDMGVLAALAERFVQRELAPGDALVEEGRPADSICLIAHGKMERRAIGKFGDDTVLDILADGDHFTYTLGESGETWQYTARAVTPCTVMTLSKETVDDLVTRSDVLRAHVEAFRALSRKPRNKAGEAAVEMMAGHKGEPVLPGTFVDYELAPREYELMVAQAVLRVHTRVADLYNHPMNQTEEQLRLTIEALRERQEREMIDNREIGLLHNADFKQRINTIYGGPSPDDFDELLALVPKDPSFFLAHPRAIAAFGQECSRLGVYPTSTELNGHRVPAWRGIPIFPCSKIPVTSSRTTSVLLLRAGIENQGVVGLHQTGIPDEYQPSLSVRFMGIDEKAIMSYLVSAYYSVAVQVPDALAVLENVEIGRAHA
jgi:CRP-like cAMP-binding protein